MKTALKIGIAFITLIIMALLILINSLNSNPALFIKTALKPSTEYIPTKLPAKSEELFSTRGDLNQNTAYVYVQGGPAMRRNIDRKNPLLNFRNAEDLLRVHPLQTQMINKTILNAGPTLTPEQGAFEHEMNVEILSRSIDHFKAQGKTVHVICHSYGTLICHEYLNSYDQEADSLVLMGFPMDIDLRTFDVGRGEIVRWDDGINPVKEDPFPQFPLKSFVKPGLDDIFSNMFRLIETNAKTRYTQVLKDKDLSHVTYVYGRFDEASGRPTQEELDFMAMKNVEIVETFGGHYSMWSESFMAQLFKKLNNETAFKPSITAAMANKLDSERAKNMINIYTEVGRSNRFASPDEEELNFLAYRTLESGKIALAIELFELITIEFPESSNAFDSLGEAYAANGDFDLAIANYRKSVALDPKNSNGKKMIKKLEGLKQ